MNNEIAVCLITYKRPILLRKCIESLEMQTHEFDLYIIDNDKEHSAKRVVKFIQHDSEIKLNYQLEKIKGIPYARNRAINTVKNDYKYLAFIDDDEVAEKDWLENLKKTLEKYDADIVAGPVYPIIKSHYPEWIKYFSHRNKYKTGQLMNKCATGNVIMKTSIFKNIKKPFLEEFKNTGGSDSHLFSSLFNQGYKIIWTSDAIVKENIEENRLKVKWFLARFFRTGNSKAFSLKSKKKYKKILSGLFESTTKLIISLILVIPMLLIYFLGFKNFYLKTIKRLVKSVGFILGTFGYKYEDYV